MIYLDTSVALAQLLGETRRPPAALWNEPLVSSRLLEYELWTRVHARRLAGRHHEDVRALVEQVSLLELSPAVLKRALQPFPTQLRTLDALHLASLDFLVTSGQAVPLASYDERLCDAAVRMGFTLHDAG